MSDKELKPATPTIPAELANIPAIEEQIESGTRVMDVLEKLGIKEATFITGAYFKQDKEKRVLSAEGVMIAETKTDTIIRFPKPDATPKDIAKAKEFKPTQKMTAAYTGKSQSTISKMKNDKK